MRTRLVWVLPLLVGALGCKPKPSEAPVEDRRDRVSPGVRPWVEATPGISPLEVCRHLGRMVAAEAGVEAEFDPALIAECEAELAIEASIRGTDGWNAIARCVLEARSEADIDACDRAHPMPGGGQAGAGPGPGPGGPPPVGERELTVCEHMIELLMLEAAAETGQIPPLTRDEQDGLIFECATALVVEQQPQLSPADYQRLLECIDSARSSDEMQRCE